jgi:hypothetical protein
MLRLSPIRSPPRYALCIIPDLAKKALSNVLAKKNVVAEKEKAAEEKTSQI